jgi:hypothetical protein
MSDPEQVNVVPHPHRDLMAEAEHERKVADSPEAQALQEEICKAVDAYWQFLEDRGVLGEDERLKATALVVTVDYARGIDIRVQNGALDRVYGNGTNPDPGGLGPPDIPHEMRPGD